MNGIENSAEPSSGFSKRQPRAWAWMQESTPESKPLTEALVTVPAGPMTKETSTLPPSLGLALRARS
jgi:hypothetical protein